MNSVINSIEDISEISSLKDLRLQWLNLTGNMRGNQKLFLDYLEKERSIEVKKDFDKRLEKSVEQISEQPYSFPQSKETKIFKCVISKETSLFYRITDEAIEIITIIDNRQNPEVIQKWLKKNFD